MKIGIYCGSFNPVHNGHIEIAKAAIEKNIVSKVLLIATDSYWKKNLWSIEDRIKMLEFFKSENIEIEKELNKIQTTFEGFKALEKRWPDEELCLIIGGDNLIKFDQWFKWKKLLEYNFIIVPRNEFDEKYINNKMKEFNKTNFEILNVPNIDISSTYIRESINDENKLDGKIDKRVLDYIKTKKLLETK